MRFFFKDMTFHTLCRYWSVDCCVVFVSVPELRTYMQSQVYIKWVVFECTFLITEYYFGMISKKKVVRIFKIQNKNHKVLSLVKNINIKIYYYIKI